MTKAQKIKNNGEIVACLLELVNLGRAKEEIHMDYFTACDKKLRDLYSKRNPENAPPFQLSEKYQLMWLDPEAYLTRGSFIQLWLAGNQRVRPEDILEENVSDYIFLFLKTAFSDFVGVTLVTSAPTIPALSGISPDIGDEADREPTPAAEGVLLELVLASDASCEQRVQVEDAWRSITAYDATSLLEGTNGIPILNGRVTTRTSLDLALRACRSLSEHGEEGELQFEDTSYGDYYVEEFAAETNFIRFIYRDTRGVIHTYEEENETLSLHNIQDRIRTIEDTPH